MSIKIHHGPPGSYKTSGAVMDDFIPAARAGRHIVTNIRGLNDIDRVRLALGDETIPEEFELTYIPTTEHPDAESNRRALATWWHWLPHGALLMLDEAQMIWPKAWKESDLNRLDYPGGLEAATAANRPHNWTTAFEMHRHYGWDMVLTTPNIDRLRPDVRQCAEGAYKHKNQAIIGLRGFYLEAFHMADDSGKSASDFLTLRNRRIRPEVWELYDSTATGSHSDTIAGLSLLANPRVLLMVGTLASCIAWFVSSGPPAVFGGGKAAASPSPAVDLAARGWAVPPSDEHPPASIRTAQNPAPDRPHDPDNVPRVESRRSDPLSDRQLFIVGQYGQKPRLTTLFESVGPDGILHLRDRDLKALGARIKVISPCSVTVRFSDHDRLITCRPRRPPAGSREEVRRTAGPLAAVFP